MKYISTPFFRHFPHFNYYLIFSLMISLLYFTQFLRIFTGQVHRISSLSKFHQFVAFFCLNLDLFSKPVHLGFELQQVNHNLKHSTPIRSNDNLSLQPLRQPLDSLDNGCLSHLHLSPRSSTARLRKKNCYFYWEEPLRRKERLGVISVESGARTKRWWNAKMALRCFQFGRSPRYISPVVKAFCSKVSSLL